MRIFCFGDSNTYGYDARSMFGDRLSETQRWPDILQKLSGWEVLNEGMNGRKIPRETWQLEDFDRRLGESGPVDRILIMLGTNDLLMSACPDMEKVGLRMEQFIRHVLAHPAAEGRGRRILLVAPPPICIGRLGGNSHCDREAERFAACYRKIADKYSLQFADAAGWGLSLAHDGVHLAPEGHRVFAEKLWDLLKNREEIKNQDSEDRI